MQGNVPLTDTELSAFEDLYQEVLKVSNPDMLAEADWATYNDRLAANKILFGEDGESIGVHFFQDMRPDELGNFLGLGVDNIVPCL
jgi:hypothetical protein